tara:strand:- start:1753 stop:3693 length:1941 start_codon:yes stop_codon:yes gene_type:complete
MKYILIFQLFFLISNSALSQTTAKVSGRIDLTKFKKDTSIKSRVSNESSDDEIRSTPLFVRLNVDVLNESYLFNDEPIVYDGNRIQSKVINGDEKLLLKYRVSNSGNQDATGVNYIFSYKSKDLNDGSLTSNNFDFNIINKPSTIKSDESVEIQVEVRADRKLVPSKTSFSLDVNDMTKKGDIATTSQFQTDFFKPPRLDFKVIVDKTASDPRMTENVDKKIDIKDYVILNFIISNDGLGPAKDLYIEFPKTNDYITREKFNIDGIDFSRDDIIGPTNIEAKKTFEVKLMYSINKAEGIEQLARGDGIEFKIDIEEDDLGTFSLADNVSIYIEEQSNDSFLEGNLQEVDILSFDEANIMDYDNSFKTANRNRNNHALIIYNSDYIDLWGVSDIPGAEDDALLIEQYFRNIFGVSSVTKIANQGKNVFNGIMESTLGTNLLGKENINLYVYYAGHGALSESGDAYFLPVDANPEKNFLEDQSINQNKFYDQLMDLENVKNVYAFIDACFSGLPKDRENKYLNNNIENDANEGRNIRAISPNKLNNKYKSKITVFTASSADQVSYSYRYFNSKYNQNNLSISNGLFTTFLAAAVQLNDDGLMNADDNKDNQLTNKEIYEYINRNVSSFSKNEQQPDWAGNNFENIIIK